MSSSARTVSDASALSVRGRRLVWGERTFLMGIVNVTPDSFSGDGLADSNAAIARGLGQLEAGADLIDVGGQSTRPGYTPVSGDEERRRVVPVILGLRAAAPGAIVSIDTYDAATFVAAHAAGADVLNSIWGLDAHLLDAAASCSAPVVIMHNKDAARYDGDVVEEVLNWLEAQARRAVARGIPPGHVVLDPGIGFGKTADDNLALLRALDRLVALGFPTLLGTSRKSTIGKLTGKDAGARAFGTAATVALAAAAGIDVVRVHDVAEMRDVVRVADGIARGWRPEGWTAG